MSVWLLLIAMTSLLVASSGDSATDLPQKK